MQARSQFNLSLIYVNQLKLLSGWLNEADYSYGYGYVIQLSYCLVDWMKL